ncbi:hypothetical protein WJX72_009561 [[Myrmecia] bisecta]|uniref:C2H2-type domain-containing protein n=1 Tax=[Myrmecia] bisecta TaxID=41462 RepID=A0AAW1Q1L2_9CHLO
MPERDLLLAGALLAAVLLVTGAEQENNVNATACDRDRSRTARSVIQHYVLPQAEELGIHMPPGCLLTPSKDLYHKQEEAKQRHQRGQWGCGFCGKVFRGEPYLDHHLDTRHQDQIAPESTVCLADYCEVLHCDYFARALQGQVQPADNPLPCREPVIAERRAVCEEIGLGCFPQSDKKEGMMLHEYFVDHLCGAHTCDTPQQHQLLMSIAKSRKRPRWGYRILAFFLALLALLFYAGLWLYYQFNVGGPTKQDIRRLRPSRANQLWSMIGIRKKKVF